MNISEAIKNIQPLDINKMKEAKEYNDNLIKPIGSLGRLEDLAIQISGITGQIHNSFQKKAILVFCADNGVYSEGVSTAPQEVTAIQAQNMVEGKTGVSVLARQGNIDLKVIDIGINANMKHPQIINKKIAYGTKNIVKEPAMTEEEFYKAITVGFDLVKELKEQGYTLLGTGEMGISNTTTAESIIIALTKVSPKVAAGKGAGLTEELFQHKIQILEQIQGKHMLNENDPLEIVRKVGGFDIAGILGSFIGAAYYKIPIVIDGVISIAAALAAYCCNPVIKDYMLPSHISAESAYQIAAKKMQLRAFFDLDMRLGEGSGCPFTMYLAESAESIMKEMYTFEEGKVDKGNYIDIREE